MPLRYQKPHTSLTHEQIKRMSFSEDALGDIKGGWAFTQNTTQEFPQFPARDLNSLQSHKLCKKKGGKKKKDIRPQVTASSCRSGLVKLPLSSIERDNISFWTNNLSKRNCKYHFKSSMSGGFDNVTHFTFCCGIVQGQRKSWNNTC